MERELGAMIRISYAELDERIRKCEPQSEIINRQGAKNAKPKSAH